MIDWILTEDYLTEALVIQYIQQLLYALEYIHERNIVHLDIKVPTIIYSVFYIMFVNSLKMYFSHLKYHLH